MATRKVDVLIAGGGPSGLSAALVLGRARRSVLLIDDEKPRNAVVRQSHGFLTRDGIEPMKLRQLAREQISQYDYVHFEQDCVESIEKAGKLFLASTRSGLAVYSRKVIIATGMKDDLPDIPGLADAYGKSIFMCPYCDGYELQSRPMAVFGQGENLVKFASVIWNWSKDLIVFTNGDDHLSANQKKELEEHGIRIIETAIAGLMSEKGMLKSVVLKNGEEIQREFGFIKNSGQHQSARLPDQLGIRLKNNGGYETLRHGLTEAAGLLVIGDAKNAFTSLIGAAGEGYEAGVALNDDLIQEDWEKSVTP
ncbi:NAD(P)/FAD-dependent oxidoreductase [Metabacillus sp. 113a]|uniref:NAD(P)/FAD-dependent oxidoreductase n=1 Tax=Metabacillus sp. 113a TaxID=3404706 RepID=UPI003CF1E6E3